VLRTFFIKLVEEIMSAHDPEEILNLYKNLDAIIFSLFKLDEEQKKLVLKDSNVNKFL